MQEPEPAHPAADPDGRIRHRMRRRGGVGEARYLTFSCHNRLPLFGEATTRDLFERLLFQEADVAGFLILAWVLMPEHAHVLGVPLKGDGNVGVWTGRLKSRLARAALGHLRQTQPGAVEPLVQPDGSTRFWLAGGGFDRLVQDPWDVRRAARYVHRNPVARGLCARPGDWRWSSAWDGDLRWDPRSSARAKGLAP